MRGFTLMELVVVIAIIGLLLSVVLATIKTARLKAADAAVFQEAVALRTVLEQERTNSGTYTAIKNGGEGSGPGGWIPANGSCDVGTPNFSGQFATNAANICRKLVSAASQGSTASTGCGTSCVFFQTTSPNSSTQYSIMAYLPYESQKAYEAGMSPSARYLCVGSSGTSQVVNNAPWNEDGCQANP